MDEASALTVRRYFKEYYFRYSNKIKEPTEIESREFGYLPFGGGMVRHLSFKDIGAFRALLVREAPAGAYCSNSYYREPSAEMHKKGWIKADLIFDIDADLLKLPCKNEHDVWLCKNCGKKDFGLRPAMCPSCNGNKILEFSWACPLCLEGTKKETFKLIDYLEEDLGIPRSKISVYFSGNAGYHLAIQDTPLQDLDQRGRAQISDYLTGRGENYQLLKSSKLSPNDPSWRGRVSKYIRDLPPNTPPFRSQDYTARLSEMAGDLKEDQVEQILDLAIKSNAIRIDAMVTTDIHRIFRMPETLNQKTGLVKRECQDLLSFDPQTEAVALKEQETETVDVIVDICPKVSLGGRSYGPFRNEEQKLPLYVAVYLIAKGAAKIVSSNGKTKKIEEGMVPTS
jgi:DNA primase small subunit